MRFSLIVFALLVSFANTQPLRDQKDKKLDENLKPHIGKYEYPKAVKDRDSVSYFLGKGVLDHYQAVYTTPDDVGEVLEWYCKNLLKTDKTGSVNYTEDFKDGRATILNHPWDLLGKEKGKRPVEILHIMQDTKEYTWAVVVSRAKGEKLTHIALSVMRKESK